MGDYAEKIKKQETGLNRTVTKIIGDKHVPNKVMELDKMHYDAQFVSSEVDEQEQFRKTYKKAHKNKAFDGVEIAAPRYDNEDFVLQERKYGYFDKKRSKRKASDMLDQWNASMNVYREEEEDKYEGHGFSVSAEAINEHTADFMLSTRRFEAIENKKYELANEILTEEALQELKNKNKSGASVLDNYRTVIMNLGPAIETEQNNDEQIGDEIRFTAESVESYKAYLRRVAEDPVGTMEAAITDTLHTVLNIPDKMFGSKAIPQTFDRLMQIRNRYNAINQLRVHRKVSSEKIDAEADPLGALMTKLYPREDKARDKKGKKGDPEDHHEHDEKINFDHIRQMEIAINSDMTRCLRDAGISYRRGMLGSSNDKTLIVSDGNASVEAYTQLKARLAAQDDKTKAGLKKLNDEHWSERIRSAYKTVNDRHLQNDQPAPAGDTYGILVAAEKIKKDSEEKKKIRYNTGLAEQFEDKIRRISESIDELKFRVDNGTEVLGLDQVKMSKELTNRIKAESKQAEYDLFILMERAKGYLNAYDHVVNGRKLDQYGSAIMSELESTEEDDWVVLNEKKAVRYNVDTVKRMNAIADTKESEKLLAENDRDAAERVRDYLADFENESTRLMIEIRENITGNRNRVIDRVITFRQEFYSAKKLLDHQTSDGKSIPVAMINTIQDEKVRNQALAAYNNTLTKCHYICFYAELYRMQNLVNIMSNGKLPDDIVLQPSERGMKEGDFRQNMRSYQLLLDGYQDDIAKYEKERGTAAIKADLTDQLEDENKEYENNVARMLAEADLSKLSDARYDEKPAKKNAEKPAEKNAEKGQILKNGDQHKEEEDKEEENKEEENKEEENKEEEHHEEQHEEQHDEEHLNEPPKYEKRVVSASAMAIVNEGSLRTTREFVDFLRLQLSVDNKINKVTWDEVRKEAKAWLVGRELVRHTDGKKVKIDQNNVDEIINELRVTFGQDDLVDQANFTEEDDALFADKKEPAPAYKAGSVASLISGAFALDSKEGVTGYAKAKVSAGADHAKLQKSIRAAYKEQYTNNVAKERINGKYVEVKDTSIPKEDQAHVAWFIEHMPKDISSADACRDYRRLWSRKVGYDMLKGKKISANTYRKIVAFLNAWESAVDNTIVQPKVKALKKHLDSVKTKTKVPDAGLADEAQTIPNVKQWYGLSCWATSGALMCNWYLKNVLKPENMPQIDQMTFLNPSNIVVNPYSEDYLRREKLDPSGDAGMESELNDIKSYVKPAGAMGNVMTSADTMLAQMSDTAVRHLRFNIPENDGHFDYKKFTDAQWVKLSYLIFNKVSGLMQGGSGPMSMLIPPHYRTIIGFKDGKLRCRDSGMNNGTTVELDLSPEEFSTILKAGIRKNKGVSLELAFLQKLDKDTKDKLKQEAGVTYNEEGKLVYTDAYEKKEATSPTNMIHNLGVTFAMHKGEPDNVLEKYLDDEVYVPKNLDHTKNVQEVKAQIEETRKKLGLPEVTEEEKQAIEAQQNEYAQIAKKKREEQARIWQRDLKEEKNKGKQAKKPKQGQKKPEQQKPKQGQKKPEQQKPKQEQKKPEQQKPKQGLKVEDFEIIESSKTSEKEQKKLEQQKPEQEQKKPEQEQNKPEQQKPKQKKPKLELKAEDFEIIQSSESFEKEILEQNTDQLKAIFKTQATQQTMPVLNKKLLSFQEQIRTKKMKAADKKATPLPMDIFQAAYVDQEKAQTKTAAAQGAQGGAGQAPQQIARQAEQPFAWILTGDDMAQIEAHLKKTTVFGHKLSEKTGSRLEDINSAVKLAKKGDASKFKHLPSVMKEYFARKALDTFLSEDRTYNGGKGELPPLEKLSKEKKAELSAKAHDPAFREAINMMIRRKAKDGKGKDAWKTAREYDAYMNRQLIVQTLSADYDDQKKSLERALRKSMAPEEAKKKADKMLGSHKVEQRQLAKMMFIMQLGRFDRHDTGEDKKTKAGHFDENISEAFAHGGQIKISLPAGTKAAQSAISSALRSRVKGYQKKTGFNLALGGLGKQTGGTAIDDSGAYGQLSQKITVGNETTGGSALIEIGGAQSTEEQTAFHTHRSTVGDAVEGRIVDLSHMDAEMVARMINTFDEKYSALQDLASLQIDKKTAKTKEGKKLTAQKAAAVRMLNDIAGFLSGKQLTVEALLHLLKFIGADDSVARDVIVSARSVEGAGYSADKNMNLDEKDKNNVGDAPDEMTASTKAYNDAFKTE
ncbi:MAG: hypothetical protein IKS16_04415 [Lachnospiraceae bacterium]|nr:hypothetical protein [Lachnospiraceae bacterium]